MRVFLIALLATFVLGAGSVVALNTAQKLTGAAYTTEGARIKQSWSTRRMLAKQGPTGGDMRPGQGDTGAESCDVASTWRWILVDFSSSADEAPECS
jgi:hypothetical protein